jgi:hypothetical protein
LQCGHLAGMTIVATGRPSSLLCEHLVGTTTVAGVTIAIRSEVRLGATITTTCEYECQCARIGTSQHDHHNYECQRADRNIAGATIAAMSLKCDHLAGATIFTRLEHMSQRASDTSVTITATIGPCIDCVRSNLYLIIFNYIYIKPLLEWMHVLMAADEQQLR